MSVTCAPRHVSGATPNPAPLPSALSTTGTSPVSIAATFGAATIAVIGVTRLAFTIHNPGGSPVNDFHLKAGLPAVMVVPLPSALSNTCGGTVTALPWTASAEIDNGSVQARSSCVVSLNVSATTAGEKTATAVFVVGGATPLSSSGARINPTPAKPPTMPTPPMSPAEPAQRRVKA